MKTIALIVTLFAILFQMAEITNACIEDKEKVNKKKNCLIYIRNYYYH